MSWSRPIIVRHFCLNWENWKSTFEAHWACGVNTGQAAKSVWCRVMKKREFKKMKPIKPNAALKMFFLHVRERDLLILEKLLILSFSCSYKSLKCAGALKINMQHIRQIQDFTVFIETNKPLSVFLWHWGAQSPPTAKPRFFGKFLNKRLMQVWISVTKERVRRFSRFKELNISAVFSLPSLDIYQNTTRLKSPFSWYVFPVCLLQLESQYGQTTVFPFLFIVP